MPRSVPNLDLQTGQFEDIAVAEPGHLVWGVERT
jgi:hypothetical protein